MTTRRKVSGYITDGENMRAANVEVKFTSNENGEMFSLCVDDITIGVKWPTVMPVIVKERAKNGKKKM